ncbi:hypothetical protein K227x_44990 [Rubripirellula lacrimiformis]|uniref:Uncharacterized protein n=1 Tax=Rubripirellula lacrimiformis TaxID=1930273 RepID=A0A517NG29_9BACT|nr:hypothetical protein [Rubripirellula lacrimiformis]QDT06092.1 hypothetical protein K227x_44990 [Rubripirellula lacrimiformis]
MYQRSLLSLALVLSVAGSAIADPPSFLRMFSRTNNVEADASKMYELTEEDGPWLILASTLVGEGSKARAQKLALEIRTELGLPAFIYNEKFDFTGTVAFDQQTSRKVRYANSYQYEAYAVLVGEYDSAEHPGIERDLVRIKTAKPKVLQDPNEMAAETDASTPVTTVKALANKWKRSRGNSPKGPMAGAFLTRNPMLPEEYFASPTVDSFVHQLNDGLNHSLLDCDGKFTVVVKTFQGVATIEGKKSTKFEPSANRMDKYAQSAAKMCAQLRSKGVEAYQFHDRDKSLVTVGSFDTLGRQLPGGGFQYDPQIESLMKKYSALNVDRALASQVPVGTNGVAGNNVGMVPFDVQPTAIAVPKLSKRSLYGAALGMR